MLQITEIKIYPFDIGDSRSKVKAYAEVTLEDTLILKGIKIIQGKKGGLFIGFPSRKGRDEGYHDLIVPKNREFHDYLRNLVLDAFKNYV